MVLPGPNGTEEHVCGNTRKTEIASPDLREQTVSDLLTVDVGHHLIIEPTVQHKGVILISLTKLICLSLRSRVRRPD